MSKQPSLDEILEGLAWAWNDGKLSEGVREAKAQISALIDRVIGEDEDLNAPAETYGEDDQSLGDNPYPRPDLQYVVRRATRNVHRAEQRKRKEELL